VGAQLSETLNEEIDSKESGFSRRRMVKGAAWTVPVILTTAAAPPASASQVSPSGFFTDTKQDVAAAGNSGNGNGRIGLLLPSKLTLTDLTNVTGKVTVTVAITPKRTDSPYIAFSTVGLGATASFVPPSSGNVFKATFVSSSPVSASVLEFSFSGYVYNGKTKSSGSYDVTTVITNTAGTVLTTVPATKIELLG
jgi:hypothetical protein